MTKIQFYAIELARNREEHNNKICGKFKPNAAHGKKTRIIILYLQLAICNDEELNKLLAGVTIARGGILSNIQAILLPNSDSISISLPKYYSAFSSKEFKVKK